MKYCEKCGKELPDAARCCSVCGGAPVDTPPENPVKVTAPVTAPVIGSVEGYWKLVYPINIPAIVSCAVLLLSNFFTFITALGFSVSLMDGSDGKIFLAAAIIGIVLCFVQKPVMPLINLIYSAFVAVMALYETSNASSELGSYSSLIKKGAGYYLLILGAVAYLIFAIAGYLAKRKAK